MNHVICCYALYTVCREALLYELWTEKSWDQRYLLQVCAIHVPKLIGENKIAQLIFLWSRWHCYRNWLNWARPSNESRAIQYLPSRLLNLPNDTVGPNQSQLDVVMVSHLLWAEDLVLLAFNAKSLPTLLNRVYHFGEEWGLFVNISKTTIMLFNKTGR